MRRRHLIGVALVAAALVFTSTAAGKEFKPGDLRLCSATSCVTIRDQRSLNMLASFIYTGRQPAVAVGAVNSPRYHQFCPVRSGTDCRFIPK